MVYDLDDTIVAIGTASGGAPRGMVRLSGPQVVSCLEKCFQSRERNFQLANVGSATVHTGTIHLDGEQSELPCELFLWPSQRSYTRQPTAEIHTVGSPALLQQLVRTLCTAGARTAEPGEFTLRAFTAGRLDLTQAEAVLGVIDAQDKSELQSALTQLAGGLSGPLHESREMLLRLLAELEAGLDFVEEDIEFITSKQLEEQLAKAQASIATAAAQLTHREDASDLPTVVLSGPPNAGKSSLFNALAAKFPARQRPQHALVSEQAGTTRDFVSATLTVSGVEFELIDTAGIEAIRDEGTIDHIAQRASESQRSSAQLVVLCDPANANSSTEIFGAQPEAIHVLTKCDLQQVGTPSDCDQLACSAVSGEGINELAASIAERLADSTNKQASSLTLTTNRCAESLRLAKSSLERAQLQVQQQVGDELVASEVREALHALGQVVGAVYTDDILDRIFSQFCIGK